MAAPKMAKMNQLEEIVDAVDGQVQFARDQAQAVVGLADAGQDDRPMLVM